MKYRFRKADKQRPSRLFSGVRLRFAGRRTLSIKRPLPEPIEIEKIRISDDDVKAPKRKRRLKVKIRLGISIFFKRIASELSAARRKSIAFVKRHANRIIQYIKLRRAQKKEKKIDSLPLLLGAALSSFLVCTVSAAYILASLFLPYAKSYDAVTIPALQGKRLDEIDLTDERFNLVIQYENNPEVEGGRIISQSPAAGVTRKIYEKNGFCDILITVSRKSSHTVPEGIVGSTLRDAALSLLNSELSYTVGEEYSAEKKGTVIRSYPAEGAELSEGGTVTLTVSAGERETTSYVPDLSGLTESEALLRIKSSGLKVGEITYARSSKRAGTVVSQTPSKSLTVKAGETVSFTVSAGEEFSAPVVPDLYGMSIDEAKESLRRVGLTVSSVYSVSSAAKAGTVIFQSPLPNTAITSAITSVELHISN